MPDREKVIKGLEWILSDIEKNGHYQVSYYAEEIQDALALFREQEPVKPLGHESMWFCGACRYAIPRTVSYCPKCGRKVDWNE